MDLQHSFTVPIGIDDAWRAFTDLEGIAPCFPGAQITSVDGDDFTGTAKVKLGPIALVYAGKGRWVSRDETAYRAVIDATGRDKRGNGTASAVITAHLEPGDGVTTVVVDTDLRITGRPAQFGRGVIQDVGSKILDQFATCLSTRLGQQAGAADGTDSTAPAVGPTSGGDAAVDVPEVGATEPGADPVSPAVGEPVGQRAVEPPAPAARRPDGPTEAPAPSREPDELDLGGVVGPVLLQRYGPILAACALTAVVTWVVARRGR